jgi:propanol-preferring alcohol dehydrogenase
MKAMVLERTGQPLRLLDLPIPRPGAGQILIQVKACGVCRTDLHVYEGDLKNPKLPLILGHEIAGVVTEIGDGVEGLRMGDRIGVPWLGKTCGTCPYCLSGRENLCDRPLFTGYHLDGGYAEYTLADYRYCFPIPEEYSDAEAAPLLCAGLIGYRAFRMAGDGLCVGIYGFGAAAHINAQIARHQGREVYAFTRPGDRKGQEFARRLGAVWAGDSDKPAPKALDAAIIFAPVGSLLPQALQAVAKGGIVVCAGIHMSDIPSFPYRLLWEERIVRSVANLTRRDGLEFFEIAPKVPVRTEVETFPLAEAHGALERLKRGQIQGAAVLVMESS